MRKDGMQQKCEGEQRSWAGSRRIRKSNSTAKVALQRGRKRKTPRQFPTPRSSCGQSRKAAKAGVQSRAEAGPDIGDSAKAKQQRLSKNTPKQHSKQRSQKQTRTVLVSVRVRVRVRAKARANLNLPTLNTTKNSTKSSTRAAASTHVNTSATSSEHASASTLRQRQRHKQQNRRLTLTIPILLC